MPGNKANPLLTITGVPGAGEKARLSRLVRIY